MFFSSQYFENSKTPIVIMMERRCWRWHVLSFSLVKPGDNPGKIKVTSTIIVFQSIKDKSSKVFLSVSLIFELRKSGIVHVYSSCKKFCAMERLPCLEGLGFKWSRYVFQKQYLKLTVCEYLKVGWLAKKKPTHFHRVKLKKKLPKHYKLRRNFDLRPLDFLGSLHFLKIKT